MSFLDQFVGLAQFVGRPVCEFYIFPSKLDHFRTMFIVSFAVKFFCKGSLDLNEVIVLISK